MRLLQLAPDAALRSSFASQLHGQGSATEDLEGSCGLQTHFIFSAIDALSQRSLPQL